MKHDCENKWGVRPLLTQLTSDKHKWSFNLPTAGLKSSCQKLDIKRKTVKSSTTWIFNARGKEEMKSTYKRDWFYVGRWQMALDCIYLEVFTCTQILFQIKWRVRDLGEGWAGWVKSKCIPSPVFSINSFISSCHWAIPTGCISNLELIPLKEFESFEELICLVGDEQKPTKVHLKFRKLAGTWRDGDGQTCRGTNEPEPVSWWGLWLHNK